MIAKKEKRTKKPERDMNLLNEIKPAGGITFKDVKYITTGSGYEGCIHIYKFPENIDTYWMAKVCNINGTVALVDISTDNMSEVKKNLNKSMKEQVGRKIGARDFAELYDADKRLDEMKRMYDEIKSYNEVIKLVHIRIFLADRSFESLEKKIKNIMDKLETDSGFLTTIYLNESKSEYKSMTRSYKKQKEEMFFPKGQSLTATGVAHGDPFHFSSLDDETGEFLGTTPCGGNGAEFTILTKTLGGKVIKLDGSEGILNPLEILKAGDDENISFTRHISKVSTFYKFLVGGSVDAEEIAEFEDVLKQLYSSFGLWSDDRRNIQCTGLPAASYPTFTDYLNFLTESMEEMQNEKYSHLEEQVVAKTLLLRDKIRKVIKNIVDTYGSLFDGHTSIDNILDEQIVTFDISTLKELKDEVFDAMIINIISLCWDNCVTNGKLMLNMLREGKIKLWDVTRFLILIDESHRWLNAKKTHALDLVSVYLREARKYFGGIGLASQRAADYVPEGSDSDAVNKLKNIFELTQYKFVFRQSSNAKKLLYQIFDGELTGTQIEKIPKLEIGQCILLISGDKNIEFKVHLTKDEDMLFSGGL